MVFISDLRKWCICKMMMNLVMYDIREIEYDFNYSKNLVIFGFVCFFINI